MIRATGGLAGDATDEEIVDGIRLLAHTEGIFTEPAGGAVVAVARKLREQGHIDLDERVVLCITGNGLKAPEALDRSHFPTVHLQHASLTEFESALEVREAGETPLNQELQSV